MIIISKSEVWCEIFLRFRAYIFHINNIKITAFIMYETLALFVLVLSTPLTSTKSSRENGTRQEIRTKDEVNTKK